MIVSVYYVLSVTIVLYIPIVLGHGRLREPPSRNSLWREGYDVPNNYDDSGMNCGGFHHQWKLHQGKCGLCGDPYGAERLHEHGGKFATGLIPRRYQPGGTMNVSIEVTANHGGTFQFHLCNGSRLTQACLNANPLPIIDHGYKYKISTHRSPIFINLQTQLPAELSCQHCVLQWKWNCGQSFGFDEKNQTMCKGCGQQEQFVNCADIAIGPDESRSGSSKNSTHKRLSQAHYPPTGNPTVETQAATRYTRLNRKFTAGRMDNIYKKIDYQEFQRKPNPGNTFYRRYQMTSPSRQSQISRQVPLWILQMAYSLDYGSLQKASDQSPNISPRLLQDTELNAPSSSMHAVQPSQISRTTQINIPNYCRGVGIYKMNLGLSLDTWCAANCKLGYCPPSHCSCNTNIACRGLGVYRKIHGSSLDGWCLSNCALNNCPKTHCICDKSP